MQNPLLLIEQWILHAGRPWEQVSEALQLVK